MRQAMVLLSAAFHDAVRHNSGRHATHSGALDLPDTRLRVQVLQSLKTGRIRLLDARKAVAAQHQFARLWFPVRFGGHATGRTVIREHFLLRLCPAAAPVWAKASLRTDVAQHAVTAFRYKRQGVFGTALGARHVKEDPSRPFRLRRRGIVFPEGGASGTRRAGLARSGGQSRTRLVGARRRRHIDS